MDAWWRSREDPRALVVAREMFADTAAAFGYTVRERSWAETLSLEALNGPNKAFSFQVAIRSVEIDHPVPSPWGRFPIETLDDNIASKMVALVERGAPRDFVDIKELVDVGLVTVERCWELWVAKGAKVDIDDARLRVKTHLERLEARRPIEQIAVERRAAAAELRAWYRDEFAARAPGHAPGNDCPDGEERSQ